MATTQNLLNLKIHKLSQTQYEREKAAGNLDSTALYLTPDTDTINKALNEFNASNHVYATGEDGTFKPLQLTEQAVSNTNGTGTIMYRDHNGRSRVEVPIENYEIANKKYVDETTAPKIAGVSYTHRRDSAQTSSIENGRVTIQDDKTATAGIKKIGQIEPMGFTALYDTGKKDSTNSKNIKQWTTLCINPAQITAPKIQHITMYLSNNIVLRNGPSTYNSTIYLSHLGYHNISNIKIYDYTDNSDDPDTYEYSDGAWNQSAIYSTDLVAEFESVDTERGKIKVLNEVRASIDWSEFKIEFDVEMEENYVYLPQKSGTIALAENMPTFELKGNILNITLPE